MTKKLFGAGVFLLTIVTGITYVFGWGVWGHNKINRGAVLALPHEMGMFFYNHADYITEESTVPDIRKHVMNDKAESPRHYIDLERYNYKSAASMPHSTAEAIEKYGKDTLDKYGILPWHIQDMMQKLTKAFREKNKQEILFLAADLGHYVADAHMPLHTTINHNGQLTGQEGIHSMWESQLPEVFGKNYSLHTPDAQYMDNIEQATWTIIDSSYRLSKRMLDIEYHLRKGKLESMLYTFGMDGQPARNKYGQLVFSYEYVHIYHELLTGMVEKQMRAAIAATSSYWYTAWVNAGRPDLSSLDPKYLTDRNQVFYKEDIKYWKTGKVTGFKPASDY